jgi:hypothetical protein
LPVAAETVAAAPPAADRGSQQPLLQQLYQQHPIELVDDWPVLGPDLSWPGTPVHLMGGLSALQIGPAARNLFGGREAAQRICRAVIKH